MRQVPTASRHCCCHGQLAVQIANRRMETTKERKELDPYYSLIFFIYLGNGRATMATERILSAIFGKIQIQISNTTRTRFSSLISSYQYIYYPIIP